MEKESLFQSQKTDSSIYRYYGNEMLFKNNSKRSNPNLFNGHSVQSRVISYQAKEIIKSKLDKLHPTFDYFNL